MTLRIAGLTPDSIVDGPGLRLAVFTQGCPHRCPGCHNPDTHDADGGRAADTGEILDMLRGNPLCDGVTLTGGEPLCQARALCHLAQEVRRMGLSVVTYTGYTLEDLLAGGDTCQLALIGQSDLLIDGPFVLKQRTLELPFRGSSNQRVLDGPASLAAGKAIAADLSQWTGSY
ncbi:MAG: anaerobic ribonucleoside-triphosphate reductase activating protein [Eubacteriales bacterium]|nr:anaerobic ribonucleoside-triphosphate reductase activating protein [Eubacteriales bacterium]